MSDVPLFGEPDQPPRERSLRDQEKDAKIGWRKYTGRETQCQYCIKERQAGGTGGIANAVYTRHEGFDVTYLCGRHTAETKIEEELAEVNSKRRPKEPPKITRPFNPFTGNRRNPRRF